MCAVSMASLQQTSQTLSTYWQDTLRNGDHVDVHESCQPVVDFIASRNRRYLAEIERGNNTPEDGRMDIWCVKIHCKIYRSTICAGQRAKRRWNVFRMQIGLTFGGTLANRDVFILAANERSRPPGPGSSCTIDSDSRFSPIVCLRTYSIYFIAANRCTPKDIEYMKQLSKVCCA